MKIDQKEVNTKPRKGWLGRVREEENPSTAEVGVVGSVHLVDTRVSLARPQGGRV